MFNHLEVWDKYLTDGIDDDLKRIYIPLSLKLVEMCSDNNDYSNMLKLLEGDMKND